MNDIAELEVRRKLQAALESGDAKAELAARREIQSKFGRMAGVGNKQALAQKHAGFDLESGLPAGKRAGLSVKMTPQGQAGYLADSYGAGNVAKGPQGEVYFRQSPESPWTLANEKGLSWGDVAGLAGPAFEAIPGIAAAVSTANPLAAAGAAGAGNLARQGVSAMLPGEDNMTPGARALDAGIAAGMAGGSQFAGNRLAGLPLIPRNAVAGHFNRAMQSDIARRGRQLEQSTGIGFYPGQLTGSKSALLAEGYARRHPITADDIAAVDEAQVAKGLARARAIQGGRVGDITAGGAVQDTFESSINRAVANRSRQAAHDFNLVTGASGNAPIFSLKNTIDEIDTMINDLYTPVGSDTANKTLRQLHVLREKIAGVPWRPAYGGNALSTEQVPPMMSLTPKQFQRTLQIWGNAAKGKGNILADVDDISTNKMINKRLFGALNRDLDAAANMPELGANTANALKQARNNYRLNSQAIDDLKGSELGRIFGGKYEPSPEKIVDRLSNMKGSEIKRTRNIIEAEDPETWGLVKSNMLERAIRNSVPNANAQNPSNFSPAKFRSYLNKHSEQFVSAFRPKEVGDIKRLYEALGRVANRNLTDGSPTLPLQLMNEIAGSAADVTTLGIAKLSGKLLAPKQIAKIMIDPQGRRALTTIVRAKKRSKAAAGAVTYLTALLAAESTADSPDIQQRIQPQ